MLDMLPDFHIDTTAIAGTGLWALALYLALASLREGIISGLDRWFNFAERSMYFSRRELKRTEATRESQNAFYASVLSIVPFLLMGIACNWGLEWSLGRSWAISTGILAVMSCGIYELGRRSTQD